MEVTRKLPLWVMALVLVAAGLPPVTRGQDGLDWRPTRKDGLSRWAGEVDPAAPHTEYPRPQQMRKAWGGVTAWQSLNGLWDYAIVRRGDSLVAPEEFSGKILVPFPVEAPLSGVGKTLDPENVLWYRRSFEVPGDWSSGGRVLLHFGAVDWRAEVRVNGEPAGEHVGGYAPFSFDISPFLKPEGLQEVVVAVEDPTGEGGQAVGLQRLKPGNGGLPRVSGIWRTVWLERVPETHIRSLKITPDVDNQSVNVAVYVKGEREGRRVSVSVIDVENEVASAKGEPGVPLKLKLKDPTLWSPEEPFLYGLRVHLANEENGQEGNIDTILSYFGMRKTSLGRDAMGRPFLMLNNHPLFHLGAIKEGYWPGGLYTAPSDAAIASDLGLVKALGFNMVRNRMKVEPARYYYHCDRLGLLVWQDLPSALPGGTVVAPDAGEAGQADLKAMVSTLYNHPSIVTWVLSDAGSVPFELGELGKWLKAYDPSRLLNEASGAPQFGGGDMADVHFLDGVGGFPPGERRASVLGEFGGLALDLPGSKGKPRKSRSGRRLKSREEFQREYAQLADCLRVQVARGLAGAAYAQWADAGDRLTGLITADREDLKLDEAFLRASHQALLLTDGTPRIEVLVGTSFAEPREWKFAAERSADWQNPGFDESAWESGMGGFGSGETLEIPVRSPWESPAIYLRTEFEVDGKGEDDKEKDKGEGNDTENEEDARLYLDLACLGAVEVYLNGVKVAARPDGYIPPYALIPLSEEASAALRKGRNTLAVSCRRKEDEPRAVDAGLIRVIPPPPPEPEEPEEPEEPATTKESGQEEQPGVS